MPTTLGWGPGTTAQAPQRVPVCGQHQHLCGSPGRLRPPAVSLLCVPLSTAPLVCSPQLLLHLTVRVALAPSPHCPSHVSADLTSLLISGTDWPIKAVSFCHLLALAAAFATLTMPQKPPRTPSLTPARHPDNTTALLPARTLSHMSAEPFLLKPPPHRALPQRPCP